MDPRLICTATKEKIASALNHWPEIAGMRIRPWLVSAVGEIFFEVQGDGVWAADPLEIKFEKVAESVDACVELFRDPHWAEERLLIHTVLLAEERGTARAQDRIYGFAPHPRILGRIDIDHCMEIDLEAWHLIANHHR